MNYYWHTKGMHAVANPSECGPQSHLECQGQLANMGLAVSMGNKKTEPGKMMLICLYGMSEQHVRPVERGT